MTHSHFYAKAQSKYLRLSPRKARLAAGLIRRLDVPQAIAQLMHSPLKSARVLLKVLKSAIANAEQKGAQSEWLCVDEVFVDGGPVLKRSKSQSRGRRAPITKRTSHCTVVLRSTR